MFKNYGISDETEKIEPEEKEPEPQDKYAQMIDEMFGEKEPKGKTTYGKANTERDSRLIKTDSDEYWVSFTILKSIFSYILFLSFFSILSISIIPFFPKF